MAIFIDSSLFCAYANLDDIHHKKSVNIIKSIVSNKYGKAITSDYIFDESVTVAMRKANKSAAIGLGNSIIGSEVFLIKVDEIVFQRAWKIFRKTKNMSFTDCTNIAFMRVFGIERIATFDKAFKSIKGIEVVDR